jgi:hypothetical protein
VPTLPEGSTVPGAIVSSEGVTMDPKKLKVIWELPTLKKKHELRTLLYSHRCIFSSFVFKPKLLHFGTIFRVFRNSAVGATRNTVHV